MSVIAVFAILVSLLGYLANRNRKTVALSSDLSFLSKIQAPVTLCLIPTSEDSDESDSEASNSEGTDTVVLDEPARSVVRATATTAVAALTKWSASLPSLGGQSYVFTFKMMIHKVNSFEEWAEKVKGVLQESQRQFRPLAEETKSTKATAALKSSRDKEPEPESSESEVCPPASMGADNEVQDRYASALKEQCLVSRRLAKDGGWVYEAATSCIDMKTIERPFRPRRRSTMRPKKNEVIPFPVSHHIDDNEFYDSLKKIDIRERRKTIDDDVDSDSEGDVSDIESEDSGSETADKHNMQFQSRRKSTDRPKTIEVEATPSPFDMLDVPSDDEDFYEALKKIVIRERRTTIVDDVDSDSEWDADDEEWDDEGQGMPSNSTGHRQVEA